MYFWFLFGLNVIRKYLRCFEWIVCCVCVIRDCIRRVQVWVYPFIIDWGIRGWVRDLVAVSCVEKCDLLRIHMHNATPGITWRNGARRNWEYREDAANVKHFVVVVGESKDLFGIAIREGIVSNSSNWVSEFYVDLYCTPQQTTSVCCDWSRIIESRKCLKFLCVCNEE